MDRKTSLFAISTSNDGVDAAMEIADLKVIRWSRDEVTNIESEDFTQNEYDFFILEKPDDADASRAKFPTVYKVYKAKLLFKKGSRPALSAMDFTKLVMKNFVKVIEPGTVGQYLLIERKRTETGSDDSDAARILILARIKWLKDPASSDEAAGTSASGADSKPENKNEVSDVLDFGSIEFKEHELNQTIYEIIKSFQTNVKPSE